MGSMNMKQRWNKKFCHWLKGFYYDDYNICFYS
ncbi:hypothetical protein MANES_12G061551v8 [Manihot esculenta]|uniref:Uncharacterized protein n=1 Tax=Manihot esculenta TaxID=3983 RepID=A0ACB7GQ82_MANES|nr:hypothetical protein MANES_12G061551v8 [Manihot esculenta]